jgi:hypothetical protein
MANSGANTNGSQIFMITGDQGASSPPDYTEWVDGLLVDWPIEEALFDIPLGLIVYSFAKSGVTPLTFDSVIVAFRDANQTVYEISPQDLTDVLKAQTEEEARALLTRLQDKIQITTR